VAGIPCKHVVCCLGHNRENLEDYCHEFYSVKRYVDTYCELMHRIPEANLDTRNMNEDIQPPPLKRLPGRLAINRRKEPGESTSTIRRSSTIKCGNCGGLGHNRKKCQSAPVAKKVTL
ncbi:hypothetical protein CFOL_v3_26754, partial [Cephalotus follicularis]